MFSTLLYHILCCEIVFEKYGFIDGLLSINNVVGNQFSIIAPELFLAVGITVIWCYSAVWCERRTVILSLRGIFAIALLLYLLFPSWQGVGVSELIIRNDLFVLFSKILIIIIALPILWLESLSITSALYFSAIILFNISLISSADLLTTYVSLEGLSLVSYGVIATNKTRGSAEAGLKYFLYGVVASALLVFGLSLLYLQSHELSWGGIYEYFAFNAFRGRVELQVLSILLILAALVYKLSLFPFHFTLPDVYEGASWHTIAVINLGVKFGVGLFLFRLWSVIVTDYLISEYLAIILSWLAIVSLIIGCFGALAQTSLKRFFAYTSINQSGFIIMGVLTNSLIGLESSILYIIVYMLSMILFFYAVNDIASDDIAELNSLGGRERLSLTLALFSMAGIPPLFGFGSKYVVWLSLFDSVSSSAPIDQHDSVIKCLLVVSILMSLISAFYYLRLIKITSFKENLLLNVNIGYQTTIVSLGIAGILLLWPLFVGVLLKGLENYSLLNYGSWIGVW